MNSKRIPLTIIVTICLSFYSSIIASSDPPFVDYRIVHSSKQYYAVVRRVGGNKFNTPEGPVDVLIALSSSEMALEARGVIRYDPTNLDYELIREKTVGVADGDQIITQLRLKEPPAQLLLAPKFQTVICVDYHGMNYRVLDGPAIVMYSTASGKERVSLTLADLYGPDFEWALGLQNSAGLLWLNEVWLLEEQNKLVVLSVPIVGAQSNLENHLKRLKVLDLSKGKFRNGRIEDVREVIEHTQIAKLKPALKYATEIGLPDILGSVTTRFDEDDLTDVDMTLLLYAIDSIQNNSESKAGQSEHEEEVR